MTDHKRYIDIDGVGVIFEVVNDCLNNLQSRLQSEIMRGKHDNDKIKDYILTQVNTITGMYNDLYRFLETEKAARENQDNILMTLVNNEVIRSNTKDSELQGLIDSEKSIRAEEINRLYQKMVSEITNLESKVKETVKRIVTDGFTDDLDSFKEIADYLKEHGSEAAEAINSLKSLITTEKERAEAKEEELLKAIKEEQKRAEEVETSLQEQVDTEKKVRVSKVNELREQLEAEVARAEAKEEEIENLIETIQGSSENVHEEIQKAISELDEKVESNIESVKEGLYNNIKEVETNLFSNITEVQNNLFSNIQEVQQNAHKELEDELNRATAKEAELQANIDAEVQTRGREDDKIWDAVNQEAEDRKAGDDEVKEFAQNLFDSITSVSSEEITNAMKKF